MNRLRGKRAIVTGGARGLGKAIATRMAEQGAAVAILDIHEGEGRALAHVLRERELDVHFAHCDVAKEREVESAFHGMATELNGLNVLVNNAGVSGANKPTHELSESEWDAVMAVNAKGVFFCTKHAIPFMKRQGGGSIINISSIYGLVGAPDVPPYHASKGAVRLMTKTDAMLYAANRIRVNSIHPGFIWTAMVEQRLRVMGDVGRGRKLVDAAHPLGHMGEPDDIAWGAVYLASDEAKFVTGAELVIDGGYTAR
jgi:NAD(P)-dependent dehydrogenase (short-subunit alcohol dehydrogenase family)